MNLISNQALRKYVVSFLLAFIITLLIFSIASVIFSFIPPKDWVLGIFSEYGYLISGFIASFFCARASSRRGFLTGAFAAVFYIAVLYMLGAAIFKAPLITTKLARVFGLSALCGGLGGILGINSK